MKTLNLTDMLQAVNRYRVKHPITRGDPNDERCIPWVTLLVGRKEDHEIQNTGVESVPSKKAIKKRWIPNLDAYEMLAGMRILVRRVDKESHFEITSHWD